MFILSFLSFMCSDNCIAVGINSDDTAVYGYIPVLAAAPDNGFGGEYPVSAPFDRIGTFKGEIPLYADFSQFGGVKLVNVIYQFAVHKSSLKRKFT
jgi:hypothetical protein